MDDPEPGPKALFYEGGRKSAFQSGGTCKASNMQKVFQSVQRVAQKSCGRAFEMFCCTSDTPMCEKVPCCTGAYHQPTEDETTQESRLNPPSTILIVNISNSTLMDCVIGNGTYQSMVADSQPLMRHAGLQMHDQRCSCSRGQQGAEQTSRPLCPPLPAAEPLNINIQRSNLNCVIIGDNNYMQAEPSAETEEPQE